MDENKEVNSTDPKREKVRVIPLSAIDDAPDHPFQVRDDDEMAELVESISTFGVINPVIVRKGEGERYELMNLRQGVSPTFSPRNTVFQPKISGFRASLPLMKAWMPMSSRER